MPSKRPKKLKPAFLASIGCALSGFILLLLGGALAGGYALWSQQLMSVQPYGDGIRAATSNVDVQAVLGPPVEPGWFVWGTAGPERVSLGVILHGSSTRGTLRIEAHKDGKVWAYDTLSLSPPEGEPIDLRNAPARVVPGPPRSSRRAEVMVALSQGAQTEALALAEVLVQDHPRWAPSWTARGMVHHARTDLDRAEADFTQALVLDPDDLDAQAGRGRVQLGREDFAGCVETLTAVLQYRTHDAELWLDRARCTEGTGDLRLAVAGARQACVLGSRAGCEMADRLR